MPAATAQPTKKTPADDSGIADDVMSGVMGRLGIPADLQAAFVPKPKAGSKEQGVESAEGEEAAETETAEHAEGETAEGEGAESERSDEAGNEGEAAEGETTEGEAEAESTEEKPDTTAELTETKTQLEAAQTRLAEVETELKTRGTKPIEIAAAQLHPVLHADSDADIAKIDAQFGAFEKWALAHWDGTEAVEGKDGQPGTPAYTAEQVRARYSDIKEQRAQLIPLAKKSLATRRNYETEAKKVYPELFDAKKPEAQMLKQVLAQAPGLKVIFPNIHMVFGDAIRGEKARLAEADKKTKAAAPARVAPKIAVRPAPGAGKPIAGAKPKVKPGAAGVSGVDISGFVAGGATRDSLVATLMKSNF